MYLVIESLLSTIENLLYFILVWVAIEVTFEVNIKRLVGSYFEVNTYFY